jgi:arabinose-5-phosphate isomerase
MLRDTARRVLTIEARAIEALGGRLDESFDRAVEAIVAGSGRVVVTGMGKSGIICQKIAATLSSTGTPALFMHPAEALHGDLGMVVKGDIVLAVSASGETEEILRLVEAIHRLGARLFSFTGSKSSSLARASEITIDVGVDSEACPMGLAPTASTAAALAMGDALAIAVYVRKGFVEDDFAAFHPGGRLGKRFLRVADVMHQGEAIPRVSPDTPVKNAILEMTRGKMGCTTVVDAEGRLAGILTDGDLRRLFERDAAPLLRLAGETMTKRPVTIARTELASVALRLMEERKITSVPVVDAAMQLEGLVQIHDLWRLQLF